MIKTYYKLDQGECHHQVHTCSLLTLLAVIYFKATVVKNMNETVRILIESAFLAPHHIFNMF